MSVSSRLWVAVAIIASLALVIGANWHLIAVAFQSQPGCVPVSPDFSAAKPGC